MSERRHRRPAQPNDEVMRLPAAPSSLGLAVKVALDHAVLAWTMLRSGAPSRQDRRRIGGEIEAARELFEARGWLNDPASYHRAPPPLDLADLRPRSTAGFRFLHLRFESGYEPQLGEPGRARWLGFAKNHTAHAWVLRHPGRPRPWLVCVHGFGMGHPLVDLTGFHADWLYRRMGLNIIVPVLPLHGPRAIAGRSGDGFLTGDILNSIHGEAHAIWDIRRILSWIRAQGAPAVGAYGVSLGGYTVALLAAIEADLACVIAGIPATDFARLARAHMPRLMTNLLEEISLPPEEVEPILRVISPLAMPPLVPWERRYLFAGLADRLVPPDQIYDLWLQWERPRCVWYAGGHVSHQWEPEVRSLLREALYASGLARATAAPRSRQGRRLARSGDQ